MIDATQLAEAIVDRFSRGDIDEEGLEEAIAAAIKTAVPKKRVPTEQAKARHREARRRKYREIMADPVQREKLLEGKRRQEKRNRQENPGRYKARDKLNRQRARERDPEGFREKQRLRDAAKAARKPDYIVAKQRRAWRAKQTPRQQQENIAKVRDMARKVLPAGLPGTIRDDAVAAVLLAYTEGRITIDGAKAEAKKALTAHNRMFDTFKTRSLDASVSGTENLCLIDTIADDHPKF